MSFIYCSGSEQVKENKEGRSSRNSKFKADCWEEETAPASSETTEQRQKRSRTVPCLWETSYYQGIWGPFISHNISSRNVRVYLTRNMKVHLVGTILQCLVNVVPLKPSDTSHFKEVKESVSADNVTIGYYWLYFPNKFKLPALLSR